MDFDYLQFLTPWIIGGIVLIFFTGINADTINNLINNAVNTFEQLIRFVISSVPFMIAMSILIIKPLREGFGKTAKIIADYPSKLLENFFK